MSTSLTVVLEVVDAVGVVVVTELDVVIVDTVVGIDTGVGVGVGVTVGVGVGVTVGVGVGVTVGVGVSEGVGIIVSRHICGCLDTYPAFSLLATKASLGYLACPMLQSKIPTSCVSGSNTSWTFIRSVCMCILWS